MDILMLFVTLFIGWILGIITLSSNEEKKAKSGKCTTFDGEIYKYVKVTIDGKIEIE